MCNLSSPLLRLKCSFLPSAILLSHVFDKMIRVSACKHSTHAVLACAIVQALIQSKRQSMARPSPAQPFASILQQQQCLTVAMTDYHAASSLHMTAALT